MRGLQELYNDDALVDTCAPFRVPCSRCLWQYTPLMFGVMSGGSPSRGHACVTATSYLPLPLSARLPANERVFRCLLSKCKFIYSRASAPGKMWASIRFLARTNIHVFLLGSLGVVDALLACGAATTAVNNRSKSALELATFIGERSQSS